MLKLHEALERVLSEVHPLASETISLTEGAGRFATKAITAGIDLPHFDNSAMDGYAVRAADVRGASRERPAKLKLVGRTPAGQTFEGNVGAGECVRVFTGSPMPQGADAVVMQEDTDTNPHSPDEVQIFDEVKAWENIRFRGEDIKQGDVLVEAGQKLTAGRLALLGAVGVTEVQAGRKPVVGILATGTELREPGAKLRPGEIYESNRLAISTLVKQMGGEPKILPLTPDSLEATREALRKAFAGCDAVVTSGGVSVGEYDFVKDAVEALRGQLSFWRVSIKPGKPFVFGRCGEKPLFGLPGNPVSAMVTFVLLVRPALMRMQGASRMALPSHPGVLLEALNNRGDRPHFVRVTVDESGGVRSAGTQASHVLGSLASANGLVEVAPESRLETGAQVRVLRWEGWGE